MPFNYELILEIQQRDSIRRSDLADLLGISDNYLYRIERGMRQPGIALTQQISAVMGIPVDRLLGERSGMRKGSEPEIHEGFRAWADMKNKLDRKCDELAFTEKCNLELKRTQEHLRAVIDLHVRFANIVCNSSLSRNEKMEKLTELAKATAQENKLSFNEIRTVLRVEHRTLKDWLRSIKQAYSCRFAEGGEILAFMPGEAALRLRCFDCKDCESGECKGYGNEKSPDNIIKLVLRLEVNGVKSRTEQAQIIGESYDTPMSQHELSEIIYRHNNGIPIPKGIFYLDRRGRQR
jgi:transcriptional regulator with XRE-family HTH domain